MHCVDSGVLLEFFQIVLDYFLLHNVNRSEETAYALRRLNRDTVTAAQDSICLRDPVSCARLCTNFVTVLPSPCTGHK